MVSGYSIVLIMIMGLLTPVTCGLLPAAVAAPAGAALAMNMELMPGSAHVERAAASAASDASLERVKVSADHRGFVLKRSGAVFHPWGVNYGNHGRLIEDFWATDWPTVATDFRNIKALGYNVVRVHLQFGKFMDSPTRANSRSLALLVRLVKLAGRVRLYLDLTGLGCYRKADVPAWYDALSDDQRWAAQAEFWRAVAGRCAPYSSVFCYDLMNEPLAPGGDRGPGKWYSGSNLGGYDFLQFIALHRGPGPREEIPPRWIRAMTAALRSGDRHTLITVGMLPWSRQPGFLSGFIPDRVAPDLDFLCVHIYPDSHKLAEATEALERVAAGKPVVIEETFPLSCSTNELEAFLLQSRGQATGWLGHYDGVTIEQYEQKRRAGTLTIGDALWESWLKLSVRIRPSMLQGLH